MARLYELLIGFRYLRSRKNQAFISLNTLLSVLIVFIGVFMLVVVISVMNGFQAQIRDRILDISPHIEVKSIYRSGRSAGFRDYNKLVSTIKQVEGVKNAYPSIHGQALLRFKGEINPVMIEGLGRKGDIPPSVSGFFVSGGDDFAVKKGVYVGEEMSLLEGIKKGDRLEIIVPRGSFKVKTGAMPGIGVYTVLGFFKTGYYPYDTRMMILSLKDAQELYGIGDRARSLSVKVNNVLDMDRVASRVQERTGFEFITETAESKNRNLFQALRLEKMIMTVILSLVIASASLTIMGTMVMVVMEKRKAVGILKAMGATPGSIMVIFTLEGFLIGVVGAFLGSVFGIVTSLNLESIILTIEKGVNRLLALVYDLFNLGPFSPVSVVPDRIYYIDTIPAVVKPEFVTFVAVLAVFLATMAALFPAWHASRLRAVETIRYE